MRHFRSAAEQWGARLLSPNYPEACAPMDEGKSKRPLDTPFRQQTLRAWRPILTPKAVIVTFSIVGIIFIPIGCVILSESDKVVEVENGAPPPTGPVPTRSAPTRLCLGTRRGRQLRWRPVLHIQL